MVTIPLGTSDWQRNSLREPLIRVKNRVFEENPTNLQEQAALFARPGFKKWLEFPDAPIRALYSSPGAFNGDLFVVAGEQLYRVSSNGVATFIAGGLIGTGLDFSPQMAATAAIGDTPEYLFLADGRNLWVYRENGFSRGTLEATGPIQDGDTIVIGGVYYRWVSTSVDAGTPDGTAGNPWLVRWSAANNAVSFDNMRYAINASGGTPGTTYSTGITAHPTVTATASTGGELVVAAKTAGVAGDSIATTVSVGTFLAWGAATLQSGGTPSLTVVPVPDDYGVNSIGHIASYVIVIISQGQGVNGRFYWIQPGETTIDPLDFATAERATDGLNGVRVFGDQFWLLGQSTTEVWYPTGDLTTPFARVQGSLFDRGVWEGTDVQIKDSIILVDGIDGTVYQITGGGPRRISTHAIEERIRKAMAEQTGSGF